MDNEKNSPEQPYGKTIFKKYSTWKKGQHMTAVMQTVPGHKTQYIGRIYFEKNGAEKKYIATRADGKEVLGVSESYVDIEKRFSARGHELALEELQEQEALEQEHEVPTAEQQQPASQKEVTAKTEPQTPADELDEIRERKGKSNDRSITR